MQSAQESKQELEAAIRYAENAISSAKRTIESMTFRQEMAKKQSSEQTGREQALEQEVVDLNKELQRMQGLSQRHYDNMMTFKEERDTLEKNVKYLRDENERLKREKKHQADHADAKRTATSKSVSSSTKRRTPSWRWRGRVYLPCPSSPRQ